MSPTLVALFLIFAQLSLLAFGGGASILPEMQRQVVEVHRWMSAQEFSALFALAQAAPGPNMMIVPLVGWHVAGLQGVLVTSVAKFGPSSLVTIVAARLWDRYSSHPWRPAVLAGLAPVTTGLVCASAMLITEASAQTWSLAAIVAVVAGLSSRTRLHPLLLLAAGAAFGLTGIGQN